MIRDIEGLHHVTSMARDARVTDRFFTHALGLRRVKKTVNFDEPSVYHLYYGNERGSPGSVMTYFPFPDIARGTPGTGEVGETGFAVPKGSLAFWTERLNAHGAAQVVRDRRLGAERLRFMAPDGDYFSLVEVEDDDGRVPWTGADIASSEAIRGFSGATLRLAETAATAELLGFMGYQPVDREGVITRFALPGGSGASVIDLQALPAMQRGTLGRGSVHHIAFAVPDRAAQARVRAQLVDTGYAVTPVIDRNYFWAIYFRTPGGVLFEIATDEPGFDHDEDMAHLGEALRLPEQHEHRRDWLEAHLPALG